VNLASDVPGLAPVTDPNLVNPWGISASPIGPFWFSDNNTGVSDLLDGNGRPQLPVVTIPAAAGTGGTPTGTVFNGGHGFVVSQGGVSAPSLFLFATEDGTLSGWSPHVNLTQAIVVVDNSDPSNPAGGAVYKGLATGVNARGQSLLFAANFRAGTVDVFDQKFRPVQTPGGFRDPNIPTGYAPFGIQNIDGRIFVTYAQQDDDRDDPVNDPGHGFIDVFDTDGVLQQRFASQGPLNSPWGVAQAPSDFGGFGGAVLVGNFGDGHINAYDPASGAFLGPLTDGVGNAITIDGLWGLSFGNGHQSGPTNVLYFCAGTDHEQHGLFGEIQGPRGASPLDATHVVYNPNSSADSYPLPPSRGPAPPPGRDVQPSPSSVLLPLSGSSLALAPILSTAGAQNTRTATPTPADQVFAASSVKGFENTIALALPAATELKPGVRLNVGPSMAAESPPGESLTDQNLYLSLRDGPGSTGTRNAEVGRSTEFLHWADGPGSSATTPQTSEGFRPESPLALNTLLDLGVSLISDTTNSVTRHLSDSSLLGDSDTGVFSGEDVGGSGRAVSSRLVRKTSDRRDAGPAVDSTASRSVGMGESDGNGRGRWSQLCGILATIIGLRLAWNNLWTLRWVSTASPSAEARRKIGSPDRSASTCLP
jgi:uncharacterized protein (TIGR03118 family)